MSFKLTISPSRGFKIPVFGYDTVIYCKTVEPGANIKRSGIYRVYKTEVVRIWPIESPNSKFDTVRVWPEDRTVVKKLNNKPILEFTDTLGGITYIFPEDSICDILLSTTLSRVSYVKEGKRVYFP